jgi:hypothetical protein
VGVAHHMGRYVTEATPPGTDFSVAYDEAEGAAAAMCYAETKGDAPNCGAGGSDCGGRTSGAKGAQNGGGGIRLGKVGMMSGGALGDSGFNSGGRGIGERNASATVLLLEDCVDNESRTFGCSREEKTCASLVTQFLRDDPDVGDYGGYSGGGSGGGGGDGKPGNTVWRQSVPHPCDSSSVVVRRADMNTEQANGIRELLFNDRRRQHLDAWKKQGLFFSGERDLGYGLVQVG